MDLSLDEFIKKQNIKRGPPNARGRLVAGRRTGVGGRINTPLQNSNGKDGKPIRRPLQNKGSFPIRGSGVTDARLKIIQKNRQRLLSTDARDKLSELAKQSDARSKIRGRNLKTITDNRMTKDSRMTREPTGRNSFTRTPATPRLLQRSIRNNTSEMRDARSLIRCTINQPEPIFNMRTAPTYNDIMDPPVPVRIHNHLSSIKVVTQNDYTHYGQEYTPNVPEPMHVDSYEPVPFSRQLEPPRFYNTSMSLRGGGARMSQEMRARLDSPAPYYSPSSPPQGHRIVVSNLHSSVTHEDIKELFEDIGPLLASRLVRPGTAEVVYKLQKDARKAVEAYHNRQLDGQPMKCLLVNPTSSSGVLRSNNMVSTPKFPTSSKSMVVPDLSAIHKALFTNK